MKLEITPKYGAMILKQVFNAIRFETAEKEELSICMRDSGYEFNYQGRTYEAKKGSVNEMGYLSVDEIKNHLGTLINKHDEKVKQLGMSHPDRKYFMGERDALSRLLKFIDTQKKTVTPTEPLPQSPLQGQQPPTETVFLE